MKNIFYITFGPVTDYMGYGLQIDTFLSQGINVQILDISKLVSLPTPHHKFEYIPLVSYITTYDELKKIITAHSFNDSLFNVQLVYELRFWKIFRLMATLPKYHFSIFLLGQLPFHRSKSRWEKLKEIGPLQWLKKVCRSLTSSLLIKSGIVRSQDIIFYVGESLSSPSHLAQKFPINYTDYDRFLENKKTSSQNYAVFLDDGLFQHPDDQILGNYFDQKTVKEYIESLNDYFDFIEKSLNIRIIIAAHPKVTYGPNIFKHREILKNATLELVQNCKFAFAHYSTSISYAVSFNKPIVFLINTTIVKNSVTKYPIEDFIKNLASHLNSPVVDTTKAYDFDEKKMLTISKEYYDNFKINYLTTIQTQNTLSREAIGKYLQVIFNS